MHMRWTSTSSELSEPICSSQFLLPAFTRHAHWKCSLLLGHMTAVCTVRRWDISKRSPLTASHERWRMNASPGLLSSQITVVDLALCTSAVTHCSVRGDTAYSLHVCTSARTSSKCTEDYLSTPQGFCILGNKGIKNPNHLHTTCFAWASEQWVLHFYNLLLVFHRCCV